VKQFYSFKLDPVNQCLWRENQRVPLTPKAFALLNHLVDNHGLLVTQSEIFEALWPDTYVQPEVLKSHIRDIRKALGDNPRKATYVETLPRRGYRFLAPVTDPDWSRSGVGAARQTIVGREAELQKLARLLDAAMGGERRLVFVTGEAGIGKTALLDAFLADCCGREKSVRIARGQCVAGGCATEPYYPFLEALGQLCHSECGRGIVRLLASEAPTWLAQFPNFAHPDFNGTNLLYGAQQNRARMPREFCEYLELLTSERPLLLVLEDLHHADAATVELISAIARKRGPAKLLLVATYRPEDTRMADGPLEIVKRDLLVRNLCEEVELQPFTEEETTEFILRKAPGLSTTGAREFVRLYSEGNPLFASAILQELLEKDTIAMRDHPVVSYDGSSAGARIPSSLRQHIELHIDRVAGSERRAIDAASVLGVSFITAVAAAVARLDPEIFEDLCEHLILRGIIRKDGYERLPEGGVTQRFRFRHLLYREVLFRRMPLVRRSRLQERAARRIEAVYAGGLEDLASELARHFDERANPADSARPARLMAEDNASLPATLHTV
jgi:DNA-binding winged helix-turn-helix (wHTH) protein